MYYLRKESYEMTIEEIKKTNGEVIPEREYMTEDRALYKATDISRFYRDRYPEPLNKGLKLYMCKKLNTIMDKREMLFEYCGEYFDVYDENGKVNIEQ